MKDYSYLPYDVAEYVYNDRIIIDLNSGYYIPRVDTIINEIKSRGFKISYWRDDCKTAIVVRPEDFNEIDKIIDMPYSL